jgi:hypothetical protein
VPAISETFLSFLRKPTGQFCVRIVPSARRYHLPQSLPSAVINNRSISRPDIAEKLYTLRLHSEQCRTRLPPAMWSQLAEQGEAILRFSSTNKG